MVSSMILTGDVNLMGVEDPAVPFRRVANGAMNERVHAEDMDVIRSTPKQFDAVRREMVVKWTKVVKETGLVAD